MDEQAKEFINIPPKDIPKVQEFRLGKKNRYKDCIKDVLVAPESVDHRIISFASKMNELNEKRCQAYGRKYKPPEIFYIDAGKAALAKDKLNRKLVLADLSDLPQILKGIGNAYSSSGNFVIVYVNCFDDPNIDAFSTAAGLMHEMSHAGSVIKFRAFPKEKKRNTIPFEPYRLGGHLQSRKKGKLGVAFDEGHHQIEDEIFAEKYPVLKKTDPFLNQFPDSEELFPSGAQNLQNLEIKAVSAGYISSDENLSIYRENHGTGENQYLLLPKIFRPEYKKLMAAIYEKGPELYKLAIDAIYGDKMIAFAKKLEQHFGKGFFRKLMEASTPEQAQALLEQIKTS